MQTWVVRGGPEAGVAHAGALRKVHTDFSTTSVSGHGAKFRSEAGLPDERPPGGGWKIGNCYAKTLGVQRQLP
jgi:hypothetical protein